ncbi:hypothetical protein GCM10022254_06250 [Actinomadura meridiana]|uniref:Carrier domain-containing protein n=1 Tax=Actinomadura meridiana TaxID=559626 RepID=A0ABP8BT23_9ACTN
MPPHELIAAGQRAPRIDGCLPPEVAADRPRFTARPYRGETGTASFPESLTAGLAALSANTGIPVEIVLLTTWAAVLHRHTGQSSLLLGLNTAGGGEPSLPLHLELEPKASFTEEASRVRTAVAAARRLTDPSEPPVGLPVLFGPPGTGEEADLALAAVEGDEPSALTLTYNASLFDRTTAAWILGHCVALLTAAAATPMAALRDLRVQDEPVHDTTWRLAVPPGYRFPPPPGPDETLVDRFTQVVVGCAARTAVTGPSGRLSYAELGARAAGTARLLGRATGSGGRVALLCDHDIGAVVGIWSVLLAGAVYVPLDPRQPDGRLSVLLADADVAAIVCDGNLRDRAETLSRGVPVIMLDPARDGVHGDMPEPPVTAESLAYLLHTSGSTGRPKAVMQNHGNVLAHALAYSARVRIGAGDAVPLLARYTFDAAVMDLFGALLTGATVRILDPLVPAARLRAELAASGASVVHCTPTLFRHLVSDLPGDTGRAAAFATVRVVVLGGEEATRDDLATFLRAFPPDSSLVNGLGPTECTVALQHLATRADLDGVRLPLGGPVEGVATRLLDPDGHPTDIFGELEILSGRVAKGYWKQDAATAVAFERADTYRTGDLVRRRADGSLEFHSRKDRQLKIRGHRVEPGEVEAALRGHPTVAEAVLTVDTRGPAPRLVGYVTPATSFAPDTADLRRFLQRMLPEHAVPWRLVSLERLPLGPTGKLDRAALPPPPENGSPTSDLPVSGTQREVIGIWNEILGVTTLGPHSDFMASGGDSVQVLRLLTEVNDRLGVEIPLLDFLVQPTVAAMAAFIEGNRRAHTA